MLVTLQPVVIDECVGVASECLGDASESALLRFCQLAYGDVVTFRRQNKKVFEIPFNSSDKFQVDQQLFHYILEIFSR